ncbi:MAG: peptidylprolyl isomerase [Anaerolineales bacterium]
MSEQPTPEIVSDDVVVSLDYTLQVDGEVIDSTSGSKPIEFLQGHGNIISGLEEALYDMKVNDSKHVIIAPEDGYGQIDEDAIIDVPIEEFPPEINLQPGVTLQVQDNDGHVMLAKIVNVADETVVLDFNHPLASKELHFDVKVVGLRAATKEEMEHGHVHDDEHVH